jgi:uncharacterized protein (TIGR03083 family)
VLVFGEIKRVEAAEFERLSRYLEGLDPDGWTEQSYCADWRVYQVASHLGSGCRIGRMRLDMWVNDGPPVGREQMQAVWAVFDALEPEQMLAEFSDAAREYVRLVASLPDAAGDKEVEGFAGKRPVSGYQIMRLWELTCHSWDMYVARDPGARLAPEAVAVLAGNLHFLNLPVDTQRASSLSFKSVRFDLPETSFSYTLDLAAERPRLQHATSSDAPLVIEGPAEEIVRLVSGRFFVPGDQPKLRVTVGQPQDFSALKRALRP